MISIACKAAKCRTAFENTAQFPDFQAEYTPAAISNGHHCSGHGDCDPAVQGRRRKRAGFVDFRAEFAQSLTKWLT